MHYSKCVFLLVGLSVACLVNSASAQTAPKIEWSRCYGGLDTARSFLNNSLTGDRKLSPTKDGGYIFTSQVLTNTGDVTGVHQTIEHSADVWIVKTTSSGSIQWAKSFGGNNMEDARSIIQTSDGGYAFCGFTGSVDGDPPKPLKTTSTDGWIVKLDSVGNIQWQRRVGGPDIDFLYSIVQTSDGGFIVAGDSRSIGNESLHNHGSDDAWVIRLDSAGNTIWEKLYGGSYGDVAYSILQLKDDGYLFVGSTYSSDGDVANKHDGTYYEAWAVRLDTAGAIIWQRTYGGSEVEEAFSVVATPDGGFGIAAYAFSQDGDVTGKHDSTENRDIWILKIDSLGNKEWDKCLGGSSHESAESILLTQDSGFVITGSTQSNDGDVSGLFLKGPDTWVCKLSSTGSLQWQKVLGGTNFDQGGCAVQTPDHGYLVYSLTTSTDGDVTGNIGGRKAWLVKLGAETNGVEDATSSQTLNDPYPNPTTSEVRMALSPASPLREITFYNQAGMRFSLDYRIEGSVAVVDLHTLRAGVYFARISYQGVNSKDEMRRFVLAP
jgi:hypothetical protein